MVGSGGSIGDATRGAVVRGLALWGGPEEGAGAGADLEGLAGAFFGAYQIMHTNPAEAMKAEAPKPVKGSGGKNTFLKLILNSRGFMSLRGIARHPVRSGFVVIGITFSFALLCVSGSMSSLLDKLIYGQFTDIRLYNMKVTLNQPVGYNSLV